MLETLISHFKEAAPKADFCSLRYVREVQEVIHVRQNVVQPMEVSENEGAMITVHHAGGMGYGATSNLSVEGLRKAGEEALAWATRTAGRTVVDFRTVPVEIRDGEYATPVKQAWNSISLASKIEMLQRQSRELKTDDRIVDWTASLWNTMKETYLVTLDGKVIHQVFHNLIPDLRATANEGSEAISRTFSSGRGGYMGGLEWLDSSGWKRAASRIATEALELLSAPNCPAGNMPLVLAPDQMILQVHESIGHPLELDRILGDERNYAGTSFVTQDMFGSYRYGSDLLNITFDPTLPEEMGSYAFDDEGRPAEKEFIIRDGILMQPLGATVSAARSRFKGQASARATSWNRPPIDRMANLNMEPGSTPFDKLIAGVENGVYMESNCSWSIDDSRNKFQFGCELGRIIENGELKQVVKRPNYRGISATFWRSLDAVGDADTFRVMGSPYCGKGEPNQGVRVGHATPAARFQNIDVFGGA